MQHFITQAFSGITVRDCLLHQTGLDPIDRKTITNEAPLKKLVENVFDEIGDFIPVKEGIFVVVIKILYSVKNIINNFIF